MPAKVLRTGVSCAALLAVASLCGCNGTLPSALAPGTSPARSSRAVPANATAPPKCKGQVTLTKSAHVVELVPAAGATLCVPSFGEIGGDLGFPGATPAQHVKLVSVQPEKFSGLDSVLTLELVPDGHVAFGASAPPGGITGHSIVAGRAYTGIAVMESNGRNKKVLCYTVAIHGKFGGVLNDLGTLLEKQSGSFQKWSIDVVPGRQVTDKC